MPTLAKVYYLTAGFKTPIDITEQAGQNLSDYQVKIVLDSSWDGWDKVSPTGSDIFFLDEYGNPLYFWIEKFDKTNYLAILWVKLPELLANSTKTIFMYYGYVGINPYVNYRSGDFVFDFFDDFEGNSLNTNKWGTHVKDAYTSISVHDGLLDIYANSSGYTGGCVYAKSSLIEREYAIEVRMQRTNAYGGGEIGAYAGFTDDNTTFNDTYYGHPSYLIISILYLYSGKGWGLRLWDTRSGVQVFGSASDYQNGVWYRVTFYYLSDDFKARFLRESDNHEVILDAGASPSTKPYYPVLGLGEYARSTHAYFDFIAIRKYISPEPTISIRSSLSTAKDLDLL